jgi:hypothetical protein
VSLDEAMGIPKYLKGKVPSSKPVVAKIRDNSGSGIPVR